MIDGLVGHLGLAGHRRDQRFGSVFQSGDDIAGNHVGAAGNRGFAFAKLKRDFFFVVSRYLDDVVVALFPRIGNTGNLGQVSLSLRRPDFEKLLNTRQPWAVSSAITPPERCLESRLS